MAAYITHETGYDHIIYFHMIQIQFKTHTPQNNVTRNTFLQYMVLIGASVYMYNFAFNYADFNYAFQKY